MHDTSPQRFEANTRSVHRENILVGAFVAIVGPGLQYLSGVRSPILLISLATIGFVAGYGIYTLRNYFQSALSIETVDSGLIVTTGRRQIQIPWAEIREVTQRSHYGPYLAIQLHNRKQPQIVRLEGYSSEQIAVIQEQIERYRQV